VPFWAVLSVSLLSSQNTLLENGISFILVMNHGGLVIIIIIFAQAFLDIPSANSRDSRRGSLCELALIFNKPFFFFGLGYVDLCLRIKQKDYAAEITGRLSALGLFADVDNGENTLPKKIRNGEIAQYNFILGLYKSASLY
jgi:hypothetical protein